MGSGQEGVPRTLVNTRTCVTGEHSSLLATAAKLLGSRKWSGEKYSTSKHIRHQPVQHSRLLVSQNPTGTCSSYTAHTAFPSCITYQPAQHEFSTSKCSRKHAISLMQ